MMNFLPKFLLRPLPRPLSIFWPGFLLKSRPLLFLVGLAFVWLGLSGCLWVASPAWAGEVAIHDRMLAIKGSLAGVNSISGVFRQSKKLDFLKEPIVSKGRFYFSQPDYLLWEYVAPAPSGLTVDGGQVTAWAGRKGNSQSPALAESARLVAGQVMLWMNMDTEAILATYKISLIAESPLILKVEPKRKGARKFLKSLEVEFNPDHNAGPNAGYNAGPNAGYNAGHNAGYNPDHNAGYNAGYSSVKRVTLHEADSLTTLTFDQVIFNAQRPSE